MSKKSRKRNKKILGILAAGLGAAALMKRRKLANATDTVNPVGGVDQMAADAASKAPVTSINKPTAPVEKKPVFLGNSRLQRDGMGPNELRLHRLKTAGNRVPPSMRSGAPHAEGYQKHGVIGTDRTGTGRPTIKRGWTGTPSLRAKGGSAYKSGGRVTGAAKRGFGRALMKGKK